MSRRTLTIVIFIFRSIIYVKSNMPSCAAKSYDRSYLNCRSITRDSISLIYGNNFILSMFNKVNPWTSTIKTTGDSIFHEILIFNNH